MVVEIGLKGKVFDHRDDRHDGRLGGHPDDHPGDHHDGRHDDHHGDLLEVVGQPWVGVAMVHWLLVYSQEHHQHVAHRLVVD